MPSRLALRWWTPPRACHLPCRVVSISAITNSAITSSAMHALCNQAVCHTFGTATRPWHELNKNDINSGSWLNECSAMRSTGAPLLVVCSAAASPLRVVHARLQTTTRCLSNDPHLSWGPAAASCGLHITACPHLAAHSRTTFGLRCTHVQVVAGQGRLHSLGGMLRGHWCRRLLRRAMACSSCCKWNEQHDWPQWLLVLFVQPSSRSG